jgi:hypothetical protein
MPNSTSSRIEHPPVFTAKLFNIALLAAQILHQMSFKYNSNDMVIKKPHASAMGLSGKSYNLFLDNLFSRCTHICRWFLFFHAHCPPDDFGNVKGSHFFFLLSCLDAIG